MTGNLIIKRLHSLKVYRKMFTQNPMRTQDLGPYRKDPGPPEYVQPRIQRVEWSQEPRPSATKRGTRIQDPMRIQELGTL